MRKEEPPGLLGLDDPVKPVPEAYIRAGLPLVTRQVRAMIQLQELTGMRPGEVVIMSA